MTAFSLLVILSVRSFALAMSAPMGMASSETLLHLVVMLVRQVPFLLFGLGALLGKRGIATGGAFLYALTRLYSLVVFLVDALSASYYSVAYRLVTAVSLIATLIGALALIVLALRVKISEDTDSLLKYTPGALAAVSGLLSILLSIYWQLEAFWANSAQSNVVYSGIDPLQATLSILSDVSMVVALFCLGLWFSEIGGVASSGDAAIGLSVQDRATLSAIGSSHAHSIAAQREVGAVSSAIEIEWTCPHCGTKVDCSLAMCPRCSSSALLSSIDFGLWDAELEKAFPGGSERAVVIRAFWAGSSGVSSR